MVSVKCEIIIIIAVALISITDCEGRRVYDNDDNQDDEDDSLDCNDGRKIDDPILLPFFEKLREQEIIPSRMKEWIVYFDENDGLGGIGMEKWNQTYLTESGLSKDNQGLPFGRVLYSNNGKNVYLPRLGPTSDEWIEFRVMYAEQLLLDAMEKVAIYVKYDPTDTHLPSLSRSATRILQKIMKRGNIQKVYVVTPSPCENECNRVRHNPLIKLATCGSAFGKAATVECRDPKEKEIFDEFEWSGYKNVKEPEYQVDLPNKLKQELHKIMDWLLNRIARRMRNYMEMAFAKNRFRKTPNDLYNKVNLQISKIRGGQTFEASKSADLIYNSLFDLNVYLNVTNTPFTFDKFASFNRYLNFIGRFTKWHLDTTKYANFFEPLKEICLRYIGSGSLLVKPATKIFELEEGVYDLTGAICHENFLYIISGLTTMNTIKSGIYDNENCQFDTVFVLAKKDFTINENLTIHGKNLMIFSPKWIIVKEQTIDLSGENGNIGEEGKSGGDFFAFGAKFEKSEFLTVISNGGEGGIGRNAVQVSDKQYFQLDEDECVPIKTEELIQKYGATRGGRGGSSGSVTLKFIRNPTVNVTVVRRDGDDGRDGAITDVTVNCDGKSAKLPVFDLVKPDFTGKRVRRMKESDALELFRKIIRKNSRRLTYEVLTFYKDIWTSPIMGQTLDSTLRDFLNASDYTKDSKEFYEITSQILHSQIKYSCNISKPQRVLLDFALTTIRMENPTEGVLPSVIDIDAYLREVSERVGRSEITSQYFEIKEAKFRKVIEEANNYLKVSLLPSLNETVENTRRYLQQHKRASVLPDAEHFEESLVMNAVLRHLSTLFEHVRLSLNDFVTSLDESDISGLDSNGLKRKLYFYREVRNNMTANEMNAMQEFLKLLKSSVEEEMPSDRNECLNCRTEIHEILRRLRESQPRNDGECQRIADDLQSRLGNRNRALRSQMLSCSECDGNCTLCGWCRACQLRCISCVDCSRCPWCVKCRSHQREDGSRCRECEKCCRSCQNCNLCPECPRCTSRACCSFCRNCVKCPRCPHCQVRKMTPCALCSDCFACPECPKCKMIALIRYHYYFGNQLCRTCPCHRCGSCPGCPPKRGEFDEIDRDDIFGWPTLYQDYLEPPSPLYRPEWHGWPRTLDYVPQDVQHFGKTLEKHFPPWLIRYSGSAGAIKTNSESSRQENFLRNSPDHDSWSNCLTNVGSYLDALFEESSNACNEKMQVACSATLKSLEKMMGKSDEHAMPSKAAIPFKCTDCNDTLEYFLEKLSTEVKKCKGDTNYNYRETESVCSPNEGVVFHMRGCDPETFSRTFDEIRGNFLKEFSQFAENEEGQPEHNTNTTPRNFVYLITNADMLLSEGIPLAEATVSGALLLVTDSLLKYKDLKREYEKKVTELHDFSETDVYDLFTAELSMQNERLDVTSRWLSQLKKLLPWIRKVTAFLSTNLNFQDVNERVLEAVRLVSEIVHNVKVVEHYRHLREYMNRVKNVDKIRSQGISKFKPVFEKTFIADVFNKAIKISENWMFPLSKSIKELRNTLREMKNATYQSQLKAVAKEIENHRKSISLYTSTQISGSQEKKTLFYKWNIRTRPTLLDDLFTGKPVILVSEILDGGRINSLTANNFHIKLVAGRRQKESAQEEIDAALVDSWFNVTHSGISYFKFGSRIYRRLTETFTFRHSAATSDGRVTTDNIDFVLSPYTTWILRFESDGEFPVQIKDKIGSIELYGNGRYVVNCGDIPEVNQYFAPLTDYRRRNGK